MANYSILLGAGASIDAGLPSSFALTRLVFEELRKPAYEKQATLFAYVISKLQTRHVLRGGSPFDSVNIEDAYDAILRLLDRDKDPLADFVYSWDPILDLLRSPFSEKEFVSGIGETFSELSHSLARGSSSVRLSGVGRAAKAISQAIGTTGSQLASQDVSALYIHILIDLLSRSSGSTEYLRSLASFALAKSANLSTLNYDILMEQQISALGGEYDYGFDQWNTKQIVSFKKGSVRLHKLHGSINWSGSPEQITISDPSESKSPWQRRHSLMIFGGQSSKLTPRGPFLQIRNEFEKSLMRSNRLLVVGYSFGDEHVNALLRRWVTTRDRAKLVIVDPGHVDFGRDVFSSSFRHGSNNELIKTVDMVHVKQSAAAGMQAALKEVQSRISIDHDRSINGFLPHIMVKRIAG